MDFLFDLPAANAVLPVMHQPIDTNPAPAVNGTEVKDPPPQPK